MGNDEGNPEEQDSEVDNLEKEEKKDNKELDKEENSEDKKNVDNLRQVIKVDEKQEEEKPHQKEEKKDDVLEGSDRDSLEQKRAILRSIKDFDFQIKKNQEEITGLNQKLDSVSKDLDDLVSLYEIVSEQMNPFVGLSKVTKKRLDALENLTNEIDDLKNRIGEMESFAEKTGANIKKISNREIKASDEKTDKNNENKSSTTMIKNKELSDNDLDKIIEKAFNAMSFDNRIDAVIDDYIENLKDMNTN